MMSRKILLSTAMVALLTWLGSPILQAHSSSEQDLKLYGRVVDADGRPVADALVDIQVSTVKDGTEKRDVAQIHTDADGRRPGVEESYFTSDKRPETSDFLSGM